MWLGVSESYAQFMVADVAPAAVRFVDSTWHARVAVDDKRVGEQGLCIVRQQLLDDLDAVCRVAVLALRMQTAKTQKQQ